MTFTLTIELGNDAMRTLRHVAGALRHVARDIDDRSCTDESGRIRDVNGNTVGLWEVKP